MTHKNTSGSKIPINLNCTLASSINDANHVYFFEMPTLNPTRSKLVINCLKALKENIVSSSVHSTYCFLIDSFNALELISKLKNHLQYRVWIAIEREFPLVRTDALPDNHISLVILSKPKAKYSHNKLQIQYTACPACNKTTKDYGGKKHLYSPYGTLMSDVWRDIKHDSNNGITEILSRTSDMFAIENMQSLKHYDFTDLEMQQQASKPKRTCSKKANIKSAIKQGDSLELMSKLENDSIDYIFADPPYNIKKKYDQWDDSIEIDEYFDWCDQWISEAYRILKPNRVFTILNIPQWVARHYAFAKKKFSFCDLIVWEGLSLPVRNIMPAHYSLLCLSKGKPSTVVNRNVEPHCDVTKDASMGLKEWHCVRQSCMKKRGSIYGKDKEPLTNMWWDIHRLKHNSNRENHPCQLPPNLMKRLIYTFTDKGEVVLDPFNGVGTTTLAANLLGRGYLGFDMSDEYCGIARQRHIQIENGEDPFGKRETKGNIAKNSRVKRLPKQKYNVPKKTLQLEVKKIAEQFNRRPTKDDVRKLSAYPFEYFEKYFIDWGEVCSAVGDKGMNENSKPSKLVLAHE